MLDVLVAEVLLDSARVLAVAGELESRGVPQHVWVHRHADAGLLACPGGNFPEGMDIDIWEVIQAASTKPFGYMPFYPGPGLGGHCIPIDPFYLTWKAHEYEMSTHFIELAGEINARMPAYVVERTIEASSRRGKALHGAKVLVLGAAYKKDIGDLRKSPALHILSLLIDRGAQVQYHDPFVPHIAALHGFAHALDSVALSEANVRAADAVIIVTDHTPIDYAALVEKASLVIDTRNATKNVAAGREKIVKA